MDAGLLNMLHDAADHDRLAIGQGIHVNFDGIFQIFVNQDGMFRRYLNGLVDIGLQTFLIIDDFHRPPAQDIGRPHHDGVGQACRHGCRLVERAGHAAGRLFQSQLVQQSLEALAILGKVNRVRRGAQNRHAGPFQRQSQLQRRLAAELHHHPTKITRSALCRNNAEYILFCQRFEIQAVGGVVIRADGFGIAVHHDGFIAHVTKRQRGVHATIVELDPLPDSIRAAAEDHDLLTRSRSALALRLVGGIQVRCQGLEFRPAGVDTFERCRDAAFQSHLSAFGFVTPQ